MSTTNLTGLALLEAGIGYIEAHPDEWNQGAWSSCLAAIVAVKLSEGIWSSEQAAATYDGPDHEYLVADVDDPEHHIEKWGIHVRFRAARLLGIPSPTGDETWELFDGDLSLNDIRHYAEQWRGRLTSPTTPAS
jgi:hypothetical protein